MTIPLSRVAAALAFGALAFFAIVLAQPSVLQVKRSGPLAGRLATMQGLVRDPARIGAWAPWLGVRGGSEPQEDGKAGVGASFTWSGGQARVEEATAVLTRYLIEQHGKGAEKYHLTLELDDQGGGLTGTLQWSSEPAGLVQKVIRLFSGPEEEIGRRLDSGLAALAEAVREEEAAQRRQEEAEREAAAERARQAARAAENARAQQEFEASLAVGTEATSEASEERKPKRLRPSQMPEDETRRPSEGDRPRR